MTREKLSDSTFMGVVINNEDPLKLGRCKVKVFQVFDRLADEDVPWATPWKDLNGNAFTVPDVGKHVLVVFDQGNKYSPEYIYAQNFNVNLERKLQGLSGEAYTSMRALIFDHSTQVYSNSADGLVLDHEYSNIRLRDTGNINVNLRDNSAQLTLGSQDADESAVLGTQFMNWMDGFIEALMGTQGGAFLDALAYPVTPSPSLVKSLASYRALRDKFVSRHVLLPKNDAIIAQTRPYVKQFGDGESALTSAASPQPSSLYVDPTTGQTREYQPDINTAGGDETGVNSTGGSHFKGGPKLKICGKERSNGEVDDLLREIRKDLYVHKGLLSSDNGRIRLQHNCMADLERLLTDAKAAGIFLRVNSAYRTLQDQIRIWQTNCSNPLGKGRCVAKPGESPAAIPGTSNHGFGLAVDLANIDGRRIKPTTTPKEWKWIQDNKKNYNFEQQNNTNETHHYNYTGNGLDCPS